MKIIQIRSVLDPRTIWEEVEERLKKYFRDLIYLPLISELNLPDVTIKNTAHPNPLMEALFTGMITFYRGTFSGKLNAEISKELRKLGATFNRRQGTYKIRFSELPMEVKAVISASEIKFQEKIAGLDARLGKILPDEISKKFKCEDLFDKALFKTDKEFRENVKKVSVVPQLTDDQRIQIAAEWQTNMEYWIQGWTKKEIVQLRKKVQKATFAGNRYGSLIGVIQKSYNVSARKAKFLASQETRLLLTKFKEVRYTDAGIYEYTWRCVHRPHDKTPAHHTPGNVRYSHGILNGKIFKFSEPPITTNPGEPVRRNNAGADYNCRCHAQGLMRRPT